MKDEIVIDFPDYLPEYKPSDFKRTNWKEIVKTFEIIYHKVDAYIKKNRIKIDAIVPILRGGRFPANYLAFRLNILRILPVQYKYFYEGKKIKLKRILDIPKLKYPLPKKPTILLVENNHCFGLTAQTAAKYLREKFPGCKIIYVADHMDYSYKNLRDFDVIFYGKLTNETKTLSEKECKKKKLINYCYLFPWENFKEEFETVSGKQFKYRDLKNFKLR